MLLWHGRLVESLLDEGEFLCLPLSHRSTVSSDKATEYVTPAKRRPQSMRARCFLPRRSPRRAYATYLPT